MFRNKSKISEKSVGIAILVPTALFMPSNWTIAHPASQYIQPTTELLVTALILVLP